MRNSKRQMFLDAINEREEQLFKGVEEGQLRPYPDEHAMHIGEIDLWYADRDSYPTNDETEEEKNGAALALNEYGGLTIRLTKPVIDGEPLVLVLTEHQTRCFVEYWAYVNDTRPPLAPEDAPCCEQNPA